jgi:hypothetical protein
MVGHEKQGSRRVGAVGRRRRSSDAKHYPPDVKSRISLRVRLSWRTFTSGVHTLATKKICCRMKWKMLCDPPARYLFTDCSLGKAVSEQD